MNEQTQQPQAISQSVPRSFPDRIKEYRHKLLFFSGSNTLSGIVAPVATKLITNNDWSLFIGTISDFIGYTILAGSSLHKVYTKEEEFKMHRKRNLNLSIYLNDFIRDNSLEGQDIHVPAIVQDLTVSTPYFSFKHRLGLGLGFLAHFYDLIANGFQFSEAYPYPSCGGKALMLLSHCHAVSQLAKWHEVLENESRDLLKAAFQILALKLQDTIQNSPSNKVLNYRLKKQIDKIQALLDQLPSASEGAIQDMIDELKNKIDILAAPVASSSKDLGETASASTQPEIMEKEPTDDHLAAIADFITISSSLIKPK